MEKTFELNGFPGEKQWSEVNDPEMILPVNMLVVCMVFDLGGAG